MKSILILLGALCLTMTMNAQIKINNPYNKDKTYIPDGDGSEDDTKEDTPSSIPSSSSSSSTSVESENADIESVVNRLFEAMYQSNSNAVKSLFLPEGRVIARNEDGTIETVAINDFAAMIGRTGKGRLREQVKAIEIRIDDYLATAWVEYDLLVDNKFDHCGTDAFQFSHTNNGWKILQIADTRHQDCTPVGPAGAVHTMLDQWHAAAIAGNANNYFNQMAIDGVYLGTDPNENWDRDAFYRFAKPFFDKGNAWKFKPSERNVFFSEDGETSWFNELLDTDMGKCRGSGVLVKDAAGAWKIKQYNLAVLVPNALLQDYIRMVEGN